MHARLALLPLLPLVLTAEDWPTMEGGGAHANASAIAIPAETLHLAWLRSLPAGGEKRWPTPTARNLCAVGQFLCVITDAPGEVRQHPPPLAMLLARSDGKEAASFPVNQEYRNHGHITWPTGMWCDANDLGQGIIASTWDPDSQVLVLKGAGDNTTCTIWRMPAGSPAYAEATPEVTNARVQARKADARLPAPRTAELASPVGQNTSGYVSIAYPWMFGTFAGHHRQASALQLMDLRTGIRVPLATMPGWRIANDQLDPVSVNELQPFAKGDSVLVYDGLLTMVGPGQDADGRGKVGDSGIHAQRVLTAEDLVKRPCLEAPDQGLVVAAWRVAGDPPTLTPAWAHLIPSVRLPQRGPHDAGSYLETDGFYRNKTMLRDGDSLWLAWKPGIPEAVQLLRLNGQGVRTFDLQVAAGVLGHKIRPHLSLTSNRRIVYLVGNCFERPYLSMTPPYQVHEAWSPDLLPPTFPTELAVFDADTERLCWTTTIDGMTPNEPIGQLDRIQMVCAGPWAWIGSVDTRGEGEAMLRLVAYDTSLEHPKALVRAIPLGFQAKEFPDSMLADLIATDGTLYALIRQSSELTPKRVTWQNQIVLALRP
jgi:hypothetical protein